MSSQTPLLKARLTSDGPKCTFSNKEILIELNRGELLWLQGPSGAGKSLCSLHLLGIQKARDVAAEVVWDPAVPASERCGMLFQQGVLIDTLTVAENIALSLGGAGLAADPATIKKAVEMVGLHAADLHKMPNELSGGMLRRAALAQLLAQKKKLIVLDEPFIGLDKDTAAEIMRELLALKASGTSFLLISHQKPYVDELKPDKTAFVYPRIQSDNNKSVRVSRGLFSVRTGVKLVDYLGYSLPLIILAFIAAGFAISMLFADVLNRTNIKDQILDVMDEEIEKNKQDNPMLAAILPMLKAKVSAVIDERSPELKAMLYCTGLAKLFVLELGPLLTALLLAGRIGGSFAGEVGTMEATNQNRLLKNLGISTRLWSLAPTVIAALIAAPVLTMIGTGIALWSGSVIVEIYDLGDKEDYWDDVRAATWSPENSVWQTYPPYVLAYRSIVFMLIIIALAEICGRWNPLLQPRDVPTVITSAVVLS
eukprot:gene5064-26938_t